MEVLVYILIPIWFLFIGIFIGERTKKVDGLFIINDADTEVTRWIIDVNFDPSEILNKKEVRLKVKIMNKEVV